jgi:hypothetical protein
MATTNTTENRIIPAQIEEAINVISGAYTSPLVDTIYALSGSSNSLRYVHNIIKVLYESDKCTEAMQLIHLLYDLAGFDYPNEMALIETNKQTEEIFIGEFLLDVEDLMYEYIAE